MKTMKFLTKLVLILIFNIKAEKENFPEKPLVVIITSFNNAQWYKKNLDSVYKQKYNNYRVIYIDDHSSDNTGNLVEEYIKNHNLNKKTILIKNREWKTQMYNHIVAVHMCKDDEIIVHLDGDDWLANDQVLSKVNEAYCKENIWLTYGGLQNWPTGKDKFLEYAKDTPENIINSNNFRSVWLYSHLRTFYAWLFKKIKLQDLIYNSSFKDISSTPDTAFMYPMLEMAGNRIKCFNEIVYIRNAVNPISQRKINHDIQKKIATEIRSWKKYTRLKNVPLKESQTTSVDCIIFKKTPEKVNNLTKQIRNNIKGINNIFVLNSSNDKALSNILEQCGEFTLIISNESKLVNIDIEKSIKNLKKTFAIGLYFSISKKDFKHDNYITLNNIHGWQINSSKNPKLQKVLNFNCTLYKTKDLFDALNTNLTGRKLGLFN